MDDVVGSVLELVSLMRSQAINAQLVDFIFAVDDG